MLSYLLVPNIYYKYYRILKATHQRRHTQTPSASFLKTKHSLARPSHIIISFYSDESLSTFDVFFASYFFKPSQEMDINYLG